MQRRNTPNKERILAVLKNRHALTAQEVCEELPDVEVSTVYRNLDRFVTDGVLRKVFVGANAAAYELADDMHDHFVCDICSDVAAIETPASLHRVLPQGAQVVEGGITVRGRCKKCITC